MSHGERWWTRGIELHEDMAVLWCGASLFAAREFGPDVDRKALGCREADEVTKFLDSAYAFIAGFETDAVGDVDAREDPRLHTDPTGSRSRS